MFAFSASLLFPPVSRAQAFTGREVSALQAEAREKKLPVGDRIAFFAEKFVGMPYDPDPEGAYVTGRRIVSDGKVDCMYLVFRSAELALSNTPEGAVKEALSLRFRDEGRLGADGRVLNYDDRYQYGEDMIASAKWGRDVTGEIGPTRKIPGSRGIESVDIIPKEEIPRVLSRFKSGDIVFFIKSPAKRVVGEIVGHLGILKVENGKVLLIHASGLKNKGGVVKKVPFGCYAKKMAFIGVKVTRFGLP